MNASRPLLSLALTLLVALGVTLVTEHAAQAQEAPGLIPVQGRLTGADDVPITDTVVGRFTLYGDPGGLMQIWSTSLNVRVDQGYFTVHLGEQTALDLAIFRDYPAVYLGMAFDDDEQMPLVQLSSVPYAGYAHFAGDAATLDGRTAEQLDALNNLGCTTNQIAVFNGSSWACSSRAVNFAELNGVPTGLTDGDDDALGELSCLDGKVPQALGGQWICADAGNYSATQPIAINGQDISIVPATITSTYIAPLTLTDGQIATNAAIDPDKIAGRAATLEGDQSFDSGTLTIDAATNRVGLGTTTPEATLDVRGDVQVDGEIRLATPRTASLHVAGAAFRSSDLDDDDPLSTSESAGYLYMSPSGVASYTSYATADVDLPLGATVTRLACYGYNSNSSSNLSLTGYLKSRSMTSTTATTMASTIVSIASGAASTSIVSNEDLTIASPDVVADTTYWLYVYMNTNDYAGTFMRFYGCSIDYTTDRP